MVSESLTYAPAVVAVGWGVAQLTPARALVVNSITALLLLASIVI
jgi:hypothetical protein